ncbi:PREDICTED: uncharacterized protein LOC109156267 [Ipomoea nil]|uniref:uncharacterized protein LOC109156267 n=1 Tax=Ipomoea nil TaxID=35883 RepID=UPI000901F65F|nr:PREDICTED: uncharacterized protein LOC109156267 [Ipomoea nil]
MQQQYPIDLRIPGAKDYSGKTDPEEHVNSFYRNMIMIGVFDAVICRAFFSTLSGRAAEWFKSVKPGSITCFADLATKFVRRFAMSRTIRKHFTHLEADFIVHPPQTYDEAIRRVTDYANAMEANSAKRRQESDSVGGTTALTRNVATLPEPGRDGRDTSKYCAYHRNRGHTTDECRVLKEVIEDLLTQFTKKKGKGKRWKKFFKRSGPDKKDKDQDLDEEPRLSGSKQVIHVIFGSLEGGDSSEERHRWCQSLHVGIVEDGRSEKRTIVEPIAFTEDDLPRNPDHGTEALIVMIDILGVDVQRVMVDTGSSVNVLYMDVFNKLKLDQAKMTPVQTQLPGFTGDTAEQEGLIRLPVEVGTYLRVMKVDMEFIVVNLACVHNVILGRPGISQIGAIISMPHLCMKFQTPEGVGVLRGDVRSTQKCYMKAGRPVSMPS